MILHGLSVLWWLALLPLLLGNLILGVFRRPDGMILHIVTGYLTLFLVTELVFVPLTLLRQPFHTAVYAQTAILLVLALLSVLLYGKRLLALLKGGARALLHQPAPLYAAAALVLLQAAVYVFFMATDLDDAWYVASATTAQYYDTLYLNGAYTGIAVTSLNYRYVLSAMPMLYAFLSEVTGMHAATVAHTILPVFFVPLAYMVYYLLADFLFRGRKDNAGIFLCLLSLIHISSYYSVYTQGTFLLIRIWQGKALLAAVLLPLLFYLCCRVMTQPAQKGDWALLFLTVSSCCMATSMGVALAPAMAAVFALLFGVLKKKWKETGRLALCFLPCAAVGALYLICR